MRTEVPHSIGRATAPAPGRETDHAERGQRGRTPRRPRANVAEDLSALGEPLVAPTSVAKFLGISRTGIYRLAGAPDGIRCVQVGGAIRFRPSDVRAYVERRTVQRAPASRVAGLLSDGPVPHPERPSIRNETR